MSRMYGILSRFGSAALAALGVAAAVGLASPAYASPPSPPAGNDTMTVTVLQSGADVMMSFTYLLNSPGLTAECDRVDMRLT